MLRVVTSERPILVDVGTGDGSYAYRLAKARPEATVVGIDPVAANMRDTAARAARKPARGGVTNLVLVTASVEDLPEELVGVADETTVILPWGRLLAGILTTDSAVKGGLATLGKEGASLRIVLNCEVWLENTPLEYADLPEPTPDLVATTVAEEFAHHGVVFEGADYMDRAAVAALRSTWARKLASSPRAPRFLDARFRRS